MNLWGLIGTVLGGPTVIGGFRLLLKARPEARKLKSDGTARLLDATTKTGTEMAEEVRDQRREIQKLWEAQRGTEARITKHLRWDAKVVDTLRGLGGEIPDPPPLYPEGT